ncbi:helix-turn-helix domain-containing protein [[Eubacterium] cellulosolvens]
MARLYPCINCNAELTRGANFCDKCGNSTSGSLWNAVQQLEDKVSGIGKRPKKIKKKPSTGRRKSVSENKFMELYKKGLNDRQIAREMNVSFSAIYRMRKKMNLSANAPRGFPKYVHEMKKKSSKEKNGTI